MVKIIKLVVLGALVSYMSGCSTYTTNNYGISTENIELMKQLSGKQFSVNSFTATKPGVTTIQCRGAGPVSNQNKKPFESYITEAFISELKLAGIYSESSSIKIDGVVEKLDFGSNVGAGKWVFDVKVSSGNSSFIVNSEYPFSTNWVADKACQQVAQAFQPAVQKLIRDIVSNPAFKDLK